MKATAQKGHLLLTDLRLPTGEVRDILCSTPKGKEGGRILEIAQKIRLPEGIGEDCLRLKGNYLTVTPPFFDAHMHCFEPGSAWLETIQSGVNASVAGGFDAFVMMPNTRPCVDSPEMVSTILDRARPHSMRCEVYPCASLTKREEETGGSKRYYTHPGHADGRTLCDLDALQRAGAVAVSDHGFPFKGTPALLDAMEALAKRDLLFVADPQDPAFPDGMANPGRVARHLKLSTVSPAAEIAGIARLLSLARFTGCRIHLQHITTAQGVELIAAAKRDGVRVSCETSPAYGVLTDEDLFYHGASALVVPPLRSRSDRDAVRKGILTGVIDCIVSDHTPCEASEKEVLAKALPGMTMAETAFPLMYHHLVRSGDLSLSDLCRRMNEIPGEIFGKARPNLQVGEVASFNLISQEEVLLERKHFHGKTHTSPFLGLPLSGMVCATVRNGAVQVQIPQLCPAWKL